MPPLSAKIWSKSKNKLIISKYRFTEILTADDHESSPIFILSSNTLKSYSKYPVKTITPAYALINEKNLDLKINAFP